MKDFSQFYLGLQALKGRYISAQVVRPGYEDVHHNSGLKGRHIMGIIQRSIVLVSNYKLPCIVPTLQAGIRGPFLTQAFDLGCYVAPLQGLLGR